MKNKQHKPVHQSMVCVYACIFTPGTHKLVYSNVCIFLFLEFLCMGIDVFAVCIMTYLVSKPICNIAIIPSLTSRRT